MAGRDPRGETRAAVRRMAFAALEGAAAGLALLLALVWIEVANLATLTRGSSSGEIGMAMLAAAFATTFGAVGLAIGAALEGRDR